MIRTAWVLVLLTTSGGTDPAEYHVREALASGEVNWSTQEIIVRGTGAPDLKAPDVAEARIGAERAALASALAKVTQVFATMRVKGELTLSGFATAPEAHRQLRPQKHTVIETRYFSDGGVDVVVAVPFCALLPSLLPRMGGRDETTSTGLATGVVIDAKGLPLRPALVPRLFSTKGELIFDEVWVRSEAAAIRGIAGYSRSVDAAIGDARVAGQPMLVKALRLRKPGTADVVISEADAEQLGRLASVLAHGRVIIVTDLGT